MKDLDKMSTATLEEVLLMLKKEISRVKSSLPEQEDKSDPANPFARFDRLRYWFSYLHTDPCTHWKLGKPLHQQSKELKKTLSHLLFPNFNKQL